MIILLLKIISNKMAAVLKSKLVVSLSRIINYIIQHAGTVKEPPVKWKIKEQLVLASAVQRSGDQNWYESIKIDILMTVCNGGSLYRSGSPLVDV